MLHFQKHQWFKNKTHERVARSIILKTKHTWNIFNTFFYMLCPTAQQTQNICIPFVQRRPNVFDVGPTLYKCYTNVLCLLGYVTRKVPHCKHYVFIIADTYSD